MAPIAVRETLQAVNTVYAEDDTAGWGATIRGKHSARASEDSTEGVAACKQRRTPQWTGR
jgi:hypothetical protein